MQDLLTTRELSAEQIQKFLLLATQIKKDPASVSALLKGKTVLQFFVENSTRTRMSFEAACRKLGATSIAFAAGTSSLNKGETLLDTIHTIRQYGVDAVVIRHSSGGSPALLANELGIPVINAGDGQHEHPTQSLLDAFTLQEKWGSVDSIKGKTIVILGDILHSRVARSNIHTFSKLGARVILCAPQTLLPSDLSLFPKIEVEYKLDQVIEHADAMYCLRIQFERQNGLHIPSRNEYQHFWGLTGERASLMKSGAVVLHPGPMNRGLEIDGDVADGDRSMILKQVENGVWVRMAVLAALLSPSEGVNS